MSINAETHQREICHVQVVYVFSKEENEGEGAWAPRQTQVHE
jgi:hypothetical protein